VSEKKRKVFSGEFKAEVALEAVRGIKTANEIAQDFGVHPTQAGQWKRELQERAASLFDAKRGVRPVDQSASPERLYAEIGRLKMELDWLKKSPGSAPSRPQALDRRGRAVAAGLSVRTGGGCPLHGLFAVQDAGAGPRGTGAAGPD
jgi:transposase-like protein